jgi:hypothetical protein
MAETVPGYVSDVIPAIASMWPPFVPRETRGEDYQASSTALPYCVLLAILFSAYALALRTVAGHSSRRLAIAVFGAGAVFLVVLATVPFMLAADVYSYAAYGRMFALYHVDPAAELTPLPADDPYKALWGEHLPTSSYGSGWTLISAGVALIAANNVGLTVLLYRGVAVLGSLASALLIANSMRRLAPDRAVQGMLFFLWNPVVVLETAVSGHNDVLMVALFLAGIALHLRGRHFLSIVSMTLSALIKFATAPLILIYLIMVLRQLPNRRARSRFLLKAAAPVTLALAATLVPVDFAIWVEPAPAAQGTDLPQPLFGSYIFQQPYINSVQELLFRSLRLHMGEDPDDVGDVEFWGWWVSPVKSTGLQSTPEEERAVGRIRPGSPLLVIQPRVDKAWLRVYEPETKRKGYVLEEDTTVINRPALVQEEPALLRWEMGRSPTAVRADFVVKLAGWSAFGLAWLMALAYAKDLPRFLLAACSLMLASYWLISTTFYAWYVIWALAFAALMPASVPALLAAIISATALTIYATTGYDNPDGMEWIYAYRSMFVFALAPLLFAAAYWKWYRGPLTGYHARSAGQSSGSGRPASAATCE